MAEGYSIAGREQALDYMADYAGFGEMADDAAGTGGRRSASPALEEPRTEKQDGFWPER